jgi:predicted transcriptional regulator
MQKEKEDGEEQDNPELFKTEIDYHRYWKDMYEKEHKLRQEAETETILVKGIGMNSPEMKEAKKTIAELRATTERFGRENNDLYNRIADALEVNESHQKLNGKLQERLTELEEDNKKMHDHLNKQVENARKSGM